jgi:short subunit dehydrogenase-like uncharacterized protein
VSRTFDIVLFGATGFTGRLVAGELARAPEKPRWAIAGRSREKLEALGLGVPALVADAHDRAALDAVAASAKVVCTTVGPYARHGGDLVAACAAAGTHYCDLTGELPWVRRMIDAHHERARATGARLVVSCGFDSIPSDLGTFALQEEFIARFGRPASSVTALYGEMSGGMSGGTIASGMQTAIEAGEDREVRRLLADPHALDPDPRAPRAPVPDERSIGWDASLGVFTAPFVMAPFNTRIVRRGHALAGFPYGEGFRYREVMSAPGTARGLATAVAFTAGLGALAFAFGRPRLRELVAARLPKPGEGPSRQRRERGHWKARFVAEDRGDRLRFVAADRADPGYGSTAKMLAQAALCLALDPLDGAGGLLTPAVAMGRSLLERLRRAGLTFSLA